MTIKKTVICDVTLCILLRVYGSNGVTLTENEGCRMHHIEYM